MQFKLVKYTQEQQYLQHSTPTSHTSENVGYVLYDDNTTKEIKDLTEDEIVEIFCEYINIYNAGNEPYISIEKFAVYNEQLNFYNKAITEWIKENCRPYNEIKQSLLAKILSVSISNKCGDKALKSTFGIYLTKIKGKKWIIRKSVYGKKTLSNAHNQVKEKKALKHDLSEITVNEIIEELETQIKELKTPLQQNDDTDYLTKQ